MGIPNEPEQTSAGGGRQAHCPPSSITTTLLSVVVLWPVLLECLQQLTQPMSRGTSSVAITAMYAAQYLLAVVYLSYNGGRVKDAEKLQDSDDTCVIGPDKKVIAATVGIRSSAFSCMLLQALPIHLAFLPCSLLVVCVCRGGHCRQP
jgi:hypothetical protein